MIVPSDVQRHIDAIKSKALAGDTQVAHVSPKGLETLRRVFGGSTNPSTGLWQFADTKKQESAKKPEPVKKDTSRTIAKDWKHKDAKHQAFANAWYAAHPGGTLTINQLDAMVDSGKPAKVYEAEAKGLIVNRKNPDVKDPKTGKVTTGKVVQIVTPAAVSFLGRDALESWKGSTPGQIILVPKGTLLGHYWQSRPQKEKIMSGKLEYEVYGSVGKRPGWAGKILGEKKYEKVIHDAPGEIFGSAGLTPSAAMWGQPGYQRSKKQFDKPTGGIFGSMALGAMGGLLGGPVGGIVGGGLGYKEGNKRIKTGAISGDISEEHLNETQDYVGDVAVNVAASKSDGYGPIIQGAWSAAKQEKRYNLGDSGAQQSDTYKAFIRTAGGGYMNRATGSETSVEKAGMNFLWDYLWNKDSGMSDSEAIESSGWSAAAGATKGLSNLGRAALNNKRRDDDPKKYTWRDAMLAILKQNAGTIANSLSGSGEDGGGGDYTGSDYGDSNAASGRMVA